MQTEQIKKLLEEVRSGSVTIDSALDQFRDLPFVELGHTKIDTHRELRKGYPEIVYGAGKTTQQIIDIASAMQNRGSNILITRTTAVVYEHLVKTIPTAAFHEKAAIITVTNHEVSQSQHHIAIITAGTSDIPVAEEAYVTAQFLGNRVEKIFDVGVAGLHRLLDRLSIIRQARVIIVIAGMEGALASVVGGLVDKPIIAVPTSVGYGASFGGLSALLGMLTSCASGVSVVNIDNGFGAAYIASLINRL
ncbi:MAG: nickel pincer cofactor biosynthesis protein LarB [Chitinivibrionales bacterium]|nr:nickel pincer cofactor biosynthesis protein LarB [Chitinivibrionales bacterium]